LNPSTGATIGTCTTIVIGVIPFTGATAITGVTLFTGGTIGICGTTATGGLLVGTAAGGGNRFSLKEAKGPAATPGFICDQCAFQPGRKSR
jgi:hypothetical protein